ncbi:hypothetical protein FACS189490_10890 [Clostridia bacterium]|nr:hypothetical protein FACS189490_10890 [Clostridia bacterium]
MDAARENAISVIKDYEGWIEFKYDCRFNSFDEISYSGWTVKEILRILETQECIPPLILIETFRDKMWEYSRYNDIFLIAYHVTEEIIDQLTSQE